MGVPYYIAEIFKKYKITDYLSQKGIEPVKKSGDKLFYTCPIHENDDDPSFIVYTGSEHENFYCFGCNASYSIIHLVSFLENISVKESFKRLISGIDINNKEALASIKEDIDKNYDDYLSVGEYDKVDEVVLKINNACYYYLKEIADFDKDEVLFFNSIYEKVDKMALNRELKNLISTYHFIFDKGLRYRGQKFLERKSVEGGV